MKRQRARSERRWGGSWIVVFATAGGCALVGGLDDDYTLLESTGGAGGTTSGGGTTGGAGGTTSGGGGTGGSTSGGGGAGATTSGGGGAGGGPGGSGGGGGALPTCSDNQHNGNETDIDCGGGTCPPCANGETCATHHDCVSGRCIAGPTCSPWTLPLPTNGEAYVEDLAMLDDGSVVMAGTFANNITLGSNTVYSQGAYDMWVAKVNHFGDWQWAHGYGSLPEDTGRGVAVDGFGDVLLVGSCGGLDFGDGSGSHGAPGNLAGCVVKLAGATGIPTWAKSFSTNTNAAFEAVTVDNNGNVYAIGTAGMDAAVVQGCNTVNGSYQGMEDVLVVAYDANGTCIWANRYGSANVDQGRAITVSGQGVVIAGDFNGTMTIASTLSFAGPDDLFIAGLTATGGATWNHGYGTSSFDGASGLATAPVGTVLLSGFGPPTLDVGNGPLGTSGTAAFVSRYGAGGVAQGQVVLGGSTATATATAEDVAAAGMRGAVGGRFDGASQQFGPTTLTNAGFASAFVTRLDLNAPMSATGALKIGGTTGADDATVTALALHAGWGKLVVGGWFKGNVNFPDGNVQGGPGMGFLTSLGTAP